MSFTILGGTAKSHSIQTAAITHPGADELPVGATQVGIVATASTTYNPLSTTYGDYQMRAIAPNLRTSPIHDMRLMERTITADSAPIITQANWAHWFAVSEQYEVVKVTPIPQPGGLLDSQAGDVNLYYTANTSSNDLYGGGVTTPTGSTTLWSYSGSYYPFTLAYEEISESKQVQMRVLTNNYGASLWYFVVTLRLKTGTNFQIMHNGQLIPATPNLWSGGSLTPVSLNLPE